MACIRLNFHGNSCLATNAFTRGPNHVFLFSPIFMIMYYAVLFPAISWGDSPRIPNSPGKNTKNTKNIKKCIEFISPPDMCFFPPPPQNLESRINTVYYVCFSGQKGVGEFHLNTPPSVRLSTHHVDLRPCNTKLIKLCTVYYLSHGIELRFIDRLQRHGI